MERAATAPDPQATVSPPHPVPPLSSRPKFPRTQLTAGIPSFRSLMPSRRSPVSLAREGRRVSVFAVFPRSSSARPLPRSISFPPVLLWFPSVFPCAAPCCVFVLLRSFLPATSLGRSRPCRPSVSCLLFCPPSSCRLMVRRCRPVCSVPVAPPALLSRPMHHTSHGLQIRHNHNLTQTHYTHTDSIAHRVLPSFTYFRDKPYLDLDHPICRWSVVGPSPSPCALRLGMPPAAPRRRSACACG